MQVDLEASVVDPDLKQMTVRYKDGGIIEELLGQQLIKHANEMEVAPKVVLHNTLQIWTSGS